MILSSLGFQKENMPRKHFPYYNYNFYKRKRFRHLQHVKKHVFMLSRLGFIFDRFSST